MSGVLLAVGVATASDAVTPKQPGTTYQVDVAGGNSQPDGESSRADLSGNGRYVVYHSEANDLVPGDANRGTDVFRSDLATPARPKVVRVSVSAGGGDPNGSSTLPSTDATGRYVAFQSAATNLVGGAGAGGNDVFLRDMAGGATSLVSVGLGGVAPNGRSTRPSVSANGCRIAFDSTATNLATDDDHPGTNVYVRDRCGTARTIALRGSGGPPNGSALRPALSGDGRYVAFVSTARNLSPQATDGKMHVYRWQVDTGAVTLVDVNAAGTGPASNFSTRPAINGNGRYVVYQSLGANLLPAGALGGADTNGQWDVYRRDMTAGVTIRVSLGYDNQQLKAASTRPAINADGHLAAFAANDHNVFRGDRNTQRDVALRNLTTSTNYDVSVAADGVTGGTCPAAAAAPAAAGAALRAKPGGINLSTRPAISDDGRRVVFVSGFCNLVTSPVDRATLDNTFVRIYPTAP